VSALLDGGEEGWWLKNGDLEVNYPRFFHLQNRNFGLHLFVKREYDGYW